MSSKTQEDFIPNYEIDDNFALALGQFMLAWADIERLSDNLIHKLLLVNHFRGTCITGNLSMASKIDIIKSRIHQTGAIYSTEECTDILNTIGNILTLSSDRNAIAHGQPYYFSNKGGDEDKIHIMYAKFSAKKRPKMRIIKNPEIYWKSKIEESYKIRKLMHEHIKLVSERISNSSKDDIEMYENISIDFL